MWEEDWSVPNEYVHNMILKAQQKLSFEARIFILIVIVMTFLPIGYFIIRTNNSNDISNSEENELDGFFETEDTIIKELYGDRKAYADSKTYHKEVDFIDKEATKATGVITYDTEAFEAYYNSFLDEFDSKVDHDKVNALLEERKAEYIASHKKISRIVKKNRIGVAGKCIWAGLVLLAFYAALYIYDGRKLKCIMNRDYQITNGTVIRKFNGASRHTFSKAFAEVNYALGNVTAHLQSSQQLSISRGESVYLVKLNIFTISGRDYYVVYRK